tara:strand:- start:1128 stop:1508 length:381 start_codon:yes stop_codon:yes gene_type:complete
MARNNYFNKGDPYSEWHRALPNDLGYIDCDCVGICLKCKQPIYLAETTFDVGQPWKATTTTAALAKMAGLPSFLIFYKVDKNREVIGFRIKQLTPKMTREKTIKPGTWVNMMELLKEKHLKEDCKK